MSERKSAEVKFRCTPSFKSGLAASADEAGESMSEYIENAVAARQNINQRIFPMVVTQDWSVFGGSSSGTLKPIAVGTVTANGPAEEGDIVRDRMTGEGYRATSDAPDSAAVPIVVSEDVPPGVVLVSAPCSCKPWEFCPHKASA